MTTCTIAIEINDHFKDYIISNAYNTFGNYCIREQLYHSWLACGNQGIQNYQQQPLQFITTDPIVHSLNTAVKIDV